MASISPEEEIRRAQRAKLILDDELFKEAVSEIEETLKQARLQSAATATDFREKIWAQELALDTIVQKLRTHIETGHLAAEEIRRKGILEAAKSFYQQL